MGSKFSLFEKSIDLALRKKGKSFSEELFRHIDLKGLKDSDVYKRAGIDRRLFSKIRNGYTPGKQIIIALAFALQLSHFETENLLEKVGYTLSSSYSFDIIITIALQEKMYDIDAVNEQLYRLKLPLIGC